ncbi:MAG: Dyp-type peroxidase [Calothrix sp. FI2-JRJ7]|jgi:Dyp-type peroxidase family|nr:Dyp-type peroxidase [Calothrix sp. FI2-JRJ7]
MTYQINLANIQGNILTGFNKDFQSFLFLTFTDTEEARRWLTDIIPEVATVEEVQAFKNLFKLVNKRRRGELGTVSSTWMNVAFTHSGFEALGVSGLDLDSFPEAFKAGMKARAAEIGDVGASDPEHWIAELGSKEIHALLIFASDSPIELRKYIMRHTTILESYQSIKIAFAQDGMDRADQPGHEHFGFRDGISQPGIRNFTTPQNPDNQDQGIPGQDLLHAGEFVLGYPTQIPQAKPDHDGPNSDPGENSQSGPTWTVDGSYLVLRRLRQDVPAFKRFVEHMAAKLGISKDLMGAKMVGRYASGAPLERTEKQPSYFTPPQHDPGLGDKSLLKDDNINNFEFGEDEEGKIVPRAAHIRKTYPRDQGGNDRESDTQTHRMLRRGIPFGSSYRPELANFYPNTEDRGLLFLAYQSDIERQFEFVQKLWVNNVNFPQPGDGEDPIMAQSPEGSFKLPLPGKGGGCPVHSLSIKHFVTTTGGEYFFQPSIEALQHLTK